MKKKILFIINYYTPYISGLTEVARILAEYYVKKGHEVTVLCENHNQKKLLEEEIINGVKVIRAKILFKISKGMISLEFIYKAVKMSKDYDVINIHAPMLELGIINTLIKRKKIIVTYQCDIDLKKGILNNLIKQVMNFSTSIGLKNSFKILVTTLDYGKHSKIASKYLDKLVEVRTPIKEYFPVKVYKNKDKKTIGFCGRIVMEKGIDILIKAYKIIKETRDDIELLIGGDYENIAGGSIYPELKQYISENNLKDIKFLGKISENKMSEFYSSLDIFILPSINPLEAFGMVQIEAMLCGIPVVSSDLYGVRTIVQNTGMGLVHKKVNEQDLAQCILKILNNPKNYIKDREYILDMYNTDKCASEYEKYYDESIKRRNE